MSVESTRYALDLYDLMCMYFYVPYTVYHSPLTPSLACGQMEYGHLIGARAYFLPS